MLEKKSVFRKRFKNEIKTLYYELLQLHKSYEQRTTWLSMFQYHPIKMKQLQELSFDHSQQSQK